MSSDIKSDKDKPKKPGRPPRDWERLFGDWLKSGLPRKDFLTSIGIDPRSGSAQKNTKHWQDALRGARDELHDQYVATIGNRRVAEVVSNVPLMPSDELARGPGDAQAQAAREAASPGPNPRTSWNKVLDWRANQANHDWKTSDTIRMHIALVLKHGLQKIRVDGRDEWATTLKPGDIRQLAMAAADVQRVQRLALGMSTDNIGVDSPDSNVEKAVESADGTKPANLFVVEMTKGGKFTRARPRRAS